MKGFAGALSSLVAKANPRTTHMVGRVKGYRVLAFNEQGIDARGTDFYAKVIELVLEKPKDQGVSPPAFTYRSIYDTGCRKDNTDLVVCCEVFECLVKSQDGLAALQRVGIRLRDSECPPRTDLVCV